VAAAAVGPTGLVVYVIPLQGERIHLHSTSRHTREQCSAWAKD
jgi:hypothetical protein